MNNHFKGKYEVELKYRLKSRTQFLTDLQSMNPEVMLENNLEYDSYFDFPPCSLNKQNKSVCIREMQPSGIMLWIVKGPEKNRCEAVNISDAAKAKRMLETMGYQRVLEVKKQRSVYFLNQFHVTVDYLEGVGDFAELAIMTDDEFMLENYKIQLLDLAQRLGLSQAQRELRSYQELCTVKSSQKT